MTGRARVMSSLILMGCLFWPWGNATAGDLLNEEAAKQACYEFATKGGVDIGMSYEQFASSATLEDGFYVVFPEAAVPTYTIRVSNGDIRYCFEILRETGLIALFYRVNFRELVPGMPAEDDWDKLSEAEQQGLARSLVQVSEEAALGIVDDYARLRYPDFQTRVFRGHNIVYRGLLLDS